MVLFLRMPLSLILKCIRAYYTFLFLPKHHILWRSAFHRLLWAWSLQHPIILPVAMQQMASIWSPFNSRFKSLTKASSSGTAWVLQVYFNESCLFPGYIREMYYFQVWVAYATEYYWTEYIWLNLEWMSFSCHLQ